MVPRRKLKQETSLIPCFASHRGRACEGGENLSAAHGAWLEVRSPPKAGKPICTKGKGSQSELRPTGWQAHAPRRHLQHPVCRSALGRCPSISSECVSPLGAISTTKWLRGPGNRLLAYRFSKMGNFPSPAPMDGTKVMGTS